MQHTVKLIEYKVNISEIEPAADFQVVGIFNQKTSKFKLEIKMIINKNIALQMKGAEMIIKFTINSSNYKIVKSTDNFEQDHNNFSLTIPNFNNLDKKLIGVIYECNETNFIDKVNITYRCMVRLFIIYVF